ncbi:MAG: nucleotidyltransferase family protein [Muribaculaceae bacterium]|nr:nucleotidyltransferase family protein [Muribaculaceae bacterium]
MKAMILAAGLGTRLRPWTLEHPKALVPVDGVPMLERVIGRLRDNGFKEIVVNIHHFGEQIIDFVRSKDFGVSVAISDERGKLLDTGGAIRHAENLLTLESGPVLVHNVDILSDADLQRLMQAHLESGADSTLLVSRRDSSRKLIFDEDMFLRGWHNIRDGVYKPGGYSPSEGEEEYAFSGIHVVGAGLLEEMKRLETGDKFSIIEFLLNGRNRAKIKGHLQDNLKLIDIGKPATLSQANAIYNNQC